MFAGIVEGTGLVRGVRDTPGGQRLTVDAGPLADGVVVGASVAVDGVCLTVSGLDGPRLDFDVITETLDRSTLGSLGVNGRVNLERSLRVGERIDGHFVQGHVDGVAAVSRRQASTAELVLWFQPASQVMRYVVPKGSVAVGGVSLTVASVEAAEFSVACIPTTLARTTLGDLNVGDRVNIETDILVRTIVHALNGIGAAGGLTEAKLREHGFL